MDYGWLGQHQRPHEHAGALSIVQMGARPYSPALGRFLTVDPVEGGSANDYDYVAADPVNSTDLDGKWPSCGWCRKAWNGAKNLGRKAVKNWKGIATGLATVGCVVVSAGVCLAGGLAVWGVTTLSNAGWNVRNINWRSAGTDLGITLAGGFAGRSFAQAWRARNVVQRPAWGAVAGRSSGRHRAPIDWRASARNWGMNALIGGWGLWASQKKTWL
ncbi:RHS repeat-associated core domain-containing protein [Actinokineospora iranica]|nr:RHS repeat-associated core domain-containing protein [Actinokineospora iranica]